MDFLVNSRVKCNLSNRMYRDKNLLPQAPAEGKTSDKILALLRSHPTLSAGDIAAIVDISRKGVEKHFARLKRYGMLQRVGPDKGGHWEVTFKPNTPSF